MPTNELPNDIYVHYFEVFDKFMNESFGNSMNRLDIVWTVYHLVIHTQSNKIHNVVLICKFIQHLF